MIEQRHACIVIGANQGASKGSLIVLVCQHVLNYSMWDL